MWKEVDYCFKIVDFFYFMSYNKKVDFVLGCMNIIYNDTKKDLPTEQLHQLFVAVGWSKGLETPDMINNYNIRFINSTLVISAWVNERLVGAVRVLSDKMFRSVIYDLLTIS